jgi:hypothetical protein
MTLTLKVVQGKIDVVFQKQKSKGVVNLTLVCQPVRSMKVNQVIAMMF